MNIKKCKVIIGLFLLHLSSTFIRLYCWMQVICCFYTNNASFALVDLLLCGQFFFKSPYRHSKQFCIHNLYGETPLMTLAKITKKSGILSSDVVYELGAGTGRTSFWLRHFVQCRVIAIEHIDIFIHRAIQVKRWCHVDRIDFKKIDMRESTFPEATWIYFYGTALDPHFIQVMTERLARYAQQARIITTSYPLADYDPRFAYRRLCIGTFPWGRTEVYENWFNDTAVT